MRTSNVKEIHFFKIHTKNYTQTLISPEQHGVDVTCVTNSGENIKYIKAF